MKHGTGLAPVVVVSEVLERPSLISSQGIVRALHTFASMGGSKMFKTSTANSSMPPRCKELYKGKCVAG